jgi:MATE family multidrug resistance protein
MADRAAPHYKPLMDGPAVTSPPLSPPPPDRLWRSEIRATLALAWPLILTNLVQMALQTTDVIMMGWLGPDALAAGALATNLYIACMISGIGLMSAVAPLAASALGARRHAVRDVRRTVRQGLWSCVAISLPLWVVLWQTEPILLALGQEPGLSADAAVYMRTMQWALLPFLAYLVLRFFLAALERPGWGLAVGGLGFVVNGVAAWCLIFGKLGFPALGLAGAGIATTFSSWVMFVALAIVVVTGRRFRRYHLFGRFWRPDWPRFRKLWRIGLPIAATLAFEVTIFNAAVFLMGLIGPVALAAHTIAIQIASMTFMVPLGFGQAATVRVGRAFGAGDRGGMERAGWISFVLGVGFMSLMACLMLFAPHLLIGVFLDLSRPENSTVVATAVSFLAFAALFQVFDGAQAVGAGMLRGLHDTRVPMLIAALGYWVIGLPLGVVLAFPLGLGGNGIWIGLAAGLAVVAVLMTVRWTMRERLHLVGAPIPAPHRRDTALSRVPESM